MGLPIIFDPDGLRFLERPIVVTFLGLTLVPVERRSTA